MLDNADFQSRLRWLHEMSPITRKAMTPSASRSLAGAKLAGTAHLDLKVIPFLEFLLNEGVELHLSPCVPGVVFREPMEYLQARGANFYGMNSKDWAALESTWEQMLNLKPQYLFDMGGGLIKRAIDRKDPIRAASEATGTGIKILEGTEPQFPIFNWDDLPYKSILHNRYDVGSGVWYSFRKLTGLDICRMRVLVIGFGPVGQSVAWIARGLGARVTVSDLNPLTQMIAASDGFETATTDQAIKSADVIVTATGVRSVIHASNLQGAKDGVFLASAGHDSREIDLSQLERPEAMLPGVEKYRVADKAVYLLAQGTLLNLATGGSSLNTFDYITALMVRVAQFIISRGERFPAGLHPFPASEVDDLLRMGASGLSP